MLFYEICYLVGYADENTLNFIGNTIQLVLSALERCIKWYIMVLK